MSKEDPTLKTRIASAALAASLFGVAAVGAVDAQQTNQKGGAAGVVAAVVNADVDLTNNQIDVAVVELNNSLNNLRALNNVLNNSPILSNNDIDVTVGDVTILQDFLNDNDIDITVEDFLNNNNIDIEDVVAIGILNGQDVIVFV